ncbi:MAG: DUF3990 domain-containing protein [Lachnospiraceae bacterium]|nr:DUF3990 domain-containing protein [Lachnospiraceae bacterium]
MRENNIGRFYEYAFNIGFRLNRLKNQLYIEENRDKSQVLLFHGAKTFIDGSIRLDASKQNNDFGPGFYCGDNIEQSVMFVASYPESSLYMLKFNSKNLKYKEFFVDQEWMLTVAYFRGRLDGYKDTDLVQNIISNIEKLDYIIAPIADNRMFELIDQFIDGEITDLQCQHCLSATDLGKQYVFLSEKALRQVEILERCYLSQGEKAYYLNRKSEDYEIARDKVKLARKQYRNQGHYIEEIIK